jgi:hypothetical protein
MLDRVSNNTMTYTRHDFNTLALLMARSQDTASTCGYLDWLKSQLSTLMISAARKEV